MVRRRPAVTAVTALTALTLAVAACGGFATTPDPTGLPGGAATPLVSEPAPTPPPPDPTLDAARCDLPPLDVRVAQLLLAGVAGTEPTAASLALVRSGVGGIVLLGSNVESEIGRARV